MSLHICQGSHYHCVHKRCTYYNNIVNKSLSQIKRHRNTIFLCTAVTQTVVQFTILALGVQQHDIILLWQYKKASVINECPVVDNQHCFFLCQLDLALESCTLQSIIYDSFRKLMVSVSSTNHLQKLTCGYTLYIQIIRFFYMLQCSLQFKFCLLSQR